MDRARSFCRIRALRPMVGFIGHGQVAQYEGHVGWEVVAVQRRSWRLSVVGLLSVLTMLGLMACQRYPTNQDRDAARDAALAYVMSEAPSGVRVVGSGGSTSMERWNFPSTIRYEQRTPGEVEVPLQVKHLGGRTFEVSGLLSVQKILGRRDFYTFSVEVEDIRNPDGTRASWQGRKAVMTRAD